MTAADGAASTDKTDPASQESRPGRAVLLTQVASAEALAATCALHGLDVVAADSPIGAYLLTDSAVGESASAALSNAVRGVPFLLLAVQDDRLTAHRWQDGARGDDVPAALLLDSLPSQVEQILIGAVGDDELGPLVRSKDIGKWKAMRILARTARKVKKEGGGA